jgi:hypothetical protein
MTTAPLEIRIKVQDAAGNVLERHEINYRSLAMRLWLADLSQRAFEAGHAVLTGPADHPDFAA